MNMNTTIQKLDELLAKVRAQLIEKKGLKEDPKQPCFYVFIIPQIGTEVNLRTLRGAKTIEACTPEGT